MKYWFMMFSPLCCLLFCGCVSLAKQPMLDMMIRPAFRSYLKETDLELAKRGIASKLKDAELLMEHIQSDELLLLLCQGFASYAFLLEPERNYLHYKAYHAARKRQRDDFLRQANRLTTRMRNLALRGRNYCLRILEKKYQGFTQAATQGKTKKESFENYLRKLSKEDTIAAFWASFGWGYALINGLGETSMTAQIPEIRSLMHRVVEVDGSYFYGSTHLFLGIFYAQPQHFGGDSKKSAYHFHKAYLHSNKKVLLAHFFEARFYAIQINDTALCKRRLTEILQHKLTDIPKTMTLLNVLAKELASIAKLNLDQFCS